MVHTNIVFDAAKAKFQKIMESWGLIDQELLDNLNYYDILNVKNCGGFAKECFPNALVQTYLHYCRKSGKGKCPNRVKELETLGWGVLYEKPVVLDGAPELLKKLSLTHKLFLITKGDRELQELKVSQSGLSGYFYRIHVVMEKNCRLFKDLIREYGIYSDESWSVGNSIKADINPALLAGIKCIHVQTPSWDFENAEPVGEYYKVNELKEIWEIIQGGRNYNKCR